MQNSQPSEGALTNAWHNAGAAAALTNALVQSPTAAVIDTGGRTSVTAECNLSVKGAIATVYVVAQVSLDGGTTWVPVQTEAVNDPVAGDVTLTDARFRKPVIAAQLWTISFRVDGCTHYRIGAYANVADAASRFMVRSKECGF